MTEGPSLTRRVVTYLVATMILAFSIAWIASLGLGLAGVVDFKNSLDELAWVRGAKLVIASLVRDDDGLVRIEPIPELRAEIQRTPGLKFAVFDSVRREALAGSSQELALALAGLAKIKPVHLHFGMADDPLATHAGHLNLERTPFGQMPIAVYGLKFRWVDLFFTLRSDLAWMSAYLIAATMMATGIAWFAVHWGLMPLRAVTGKAALIDLSSLHQRLPVDGVPAEISSLVEAMNKMLERLDASAMRMRLYTANAAHELRTPLTILRARLENTENSGVKGFLLRDVSRLQAIVEQTLIAARLTEKQVALDQELDLVRTVREITSSYLQLAIECDRMIEFETETPVLITRGNQRAIESIISNLIDNALRAEPVDGTVLIKVRADPMVEVIDHGAGVAPSDREKIFEPFWRKNESTPGSGLGLAIAKELIDKLGGRIWVEETPGGGATFKLAFAVTCSQ